jgi:hypothetical protein
MSPDGWYAFLGGDVIVHHGLPSHDTLTVWGHGRRWVDQQWLAQLASYGLYSLGGLRLALLANAAIVVGSFVVALRLARARNLEISVLAAISLGLTSSTLRPQTLALPLFVAISWLLVEDARAPSRRVYLTIPLLVLWANLHGSVLVGVLLVLLALAADAWPRRHPTGRTSLLAVLAVASPLASPYAPHLPAYYRTVVFNGDFARYLPDWMPTALSPRTAAFYVLALLTLFAMARASQAMTSFERLAIIILLAAAIVQRQGITWFVLFTTIALRSPLPRLSSPGVERQRLRVLLTSALSAAAVLALGIAATRPSSWYTREYPSAAARTVKLAAGKDGRTFARGTFGDWLLLVEPSLRSRIAYDVRYAIYSHSALVDIASVAIGRWDAQQILKPFDVVVLTPSEVELRAILTQSRNWERVGADSKVVVLRRVSG